MRKLIGRLILKPVIELDSQYVMKEISPWNTSSISRITGDQVVLIFKWRILSKHYMMVMYHKWTLHGCPSQTNLVLSNGKITCYYELIYGRPNANKPFDYEYP